MGKLAAPVSSGKSMNGTEMELVQGVFLLCSYLGRRFRSAISDAEELYVNIHLATRLATED